MLIPTCGGFFWGGWRGAEGTRHTCTDVLCDTSYYRIFCAYAVSFGMTWRSIETQQLVYIITYNCADTVKFPTRESFG